MHGVKRLFAWMIPRFDQAALQRLADQPAQEGSVRRHARRVRHRRHLPGAAQVRSGDAPGAAEGAARKSADIVHMHGYGATTFGRLCAWRMGIPAILHEHANLTATRRGSRKSPIACWRRTPTWRSRCRSRRRSSRSRARLMPAERTKVVYLGAPLDEFARPRSADEIARRARALGIAPGRFAVGTVTRLMPSKGNQYLVEAAPSVLRSASRTPAFFIVGEGELQAELEAQARALGLGDRLVFCGFQRDVAPALSALDIVVFPSLWEGTPLTVFEALAMGKPIVATDADGLLDVLTDGRRADRAEARRRGAGAEHRRARERCPRSASVSARVPAPPDASYDIAAFVRKMERLYQLLHEPSRATKRQGILQADLSFSDRWRRR